MAELISHRVMNPPEKTEPGSLRIRDDAGSDRYRALPGGLRLVCRAPSYERLNGKEKYRSSEIDLFPSPGAAGETIAAVLPRNISGNNQTEPLTDLKRLISV